MGYGISLNCSLVEQDGNYDMGFHLNNTDGIDIDYAISGDDPEKILEEALNDIFDEIFVQGRAIEAEKENNKENLKDEKYIKQLEDIIKNLAAENDSLKIDNKILQKRVDDTLNQSTQEYDINDEFFNHLFKN